MCDVHEFVVDDVGEMIRRKTIGLDENRVIVHRLIRQVLLTLCISVSRFAIDEIVIFGIVLRGSEPHYVAFTTFDALLDISGWKVDTLPVVAKRKSLIVAQAIQVVYSLG